MEQKQNSKLDQDKAWLSGFADGEGCFYVSFTQRDRFKTGIETRLSFSISQKKNSLGALKRVREILEGGAIRYSKADGIYKYETRDQTHIHRRVIPLFQEYTLHTHKRNDFEYFRQISRLVSQNKHRNINSLRGIIDLAYKMNTRGQRRKYTKMELLKILEKLKV